MLQERPDRLITVLPNGLIIVAQNLPTAPVVSAQVWIKTGSIYEQEHVGAGLSHFLEHLASGGSTSKRTEEESNAILGRIGARTNAATSLDTVRYYINTTSSFSSEAIDLLSDWMQNAVISQAEFDREREVIQREFDMGRGDPSRIFWKLTQQARYGGTAHPAQHPTIGYLDEFMSITRDEIYDFYKRMYVPNNMVFVVAGDIDPGEVVAQVTGLWEGAKRGELPEISLPVDGGVNGEQIANDASDASEPIRGSADIQRPRIRIAWPGTRLTGPHDYALDLLGTILGQGESSRLVKKVRDEAKLVNTISAYNLSFSWGEGFFGVDAELREDDPSEVEALILEAVTKLSEEPVSEQELARVKRQTLASSLYSGQTAEGLASELASSLISLGDPDYQRRYVAAIQKLTAADLQAAAQALLVPENRMTLLLEPTTKGEETAAEQVRPESSVEADGLVRRDVDLDNAQLVQTFESALASENAAGEHTEIEADDIEEITLSNGQRVLLGRSTLVPAVSLHWYRLGGLLGEEPGSEGIATAAAEMMLKGAGDRDAAEIAALLEGLGASLGVGCGNNTIYVRGRSLKEDFPTLVDLASDVMLRPTFPEDEWAKLRPRLVAAIARIGDRWSGELQQAFRAAYFGDHPWSQTALGREEVVGDLTAEDLRGYHAGRFTAAESVMAVFGDFDRDTIVSMLEDAFAKMPGDVAERFAPPMPPKQESRVVVNETSKPLVAAAIGFGPGVKVTDPDYPAMLVLGRVISSFPTGYLDRALRGSDGGLVYAVGGYNVSGVVPGYFGVLFNTQPATAVEAVRRSVSVIERVKTEAVDAETLARAKAGVLTDQFLSRQSNGDRAAGAALDVLYGAGLGRAEWMREQIEAMDAKTLMSVAEKRLNNATAVLITNEDLPVDDLEAAVTGKSPTTQPATQPATPPAAQPAGVGTP